ncbi:MAG: hypothetical protein ACK5PZ_13125, partial [Pirellula sp.]
MEASYPTVQKYWDINIPIPKNQNQAPMREIHKYLATNRSPSEDSLLDVSERVKRSHGKKGRHEIPLGCFFKRAPVPKPNLGDWAFSFRSFGGRLFLDFGCPDRCNRPIEGFSTRTQPRNWLFGERMPRGVSHRGPAPAGHRGAL